MDDDRLAQAIQRISSQDLQLKKNWYSPSAEAYNATRPAYPSELVRKAFNTAQLSQSSRILEIGCGPGTATVSFAALGCRMVCIEPNPVFYEMAVTHCQSHPSVHVINTSFEEWDLEPEAFNAVLAASSMHWIPAGIGYAKASSALKEGGHLILLWNKELQPCESMQNALATAYQRHAPSLGQPEDRKTQEEILKGLGQMMLESGFFEDLASSTVETALSYTSDQYTSLLSTYSPYLSLDRHARNALFAEIRQAILESGGDTIHLSYLSTFHIARKRLSSGECFG